ncbi:MAG: hypothetical protein QW416_09330 [Candidatus Nitrosocaldaceae archaeon]
MGTVDVVQIRNTLSTDELRHAEILGKIVKILRASYNMKSQRSSAWSKARKFLYPDVTQNDRDSGKVAIPIIYWIVDNFRNKIVNLFLSKFPPIQLEPVGPEDVLASVANEIVLSYQLNRQSNSFSTMLYNVVYNLLVYGMGVMSVEWIDDIRKMNYWREENIKVLDADGNPVTITQVMRTSKEHTYYRGNVFTSVNPLNFILDPYTPMLKRNEVIIGGEVKLHSLVRLRELYGNKENIINLHKVREIQEGVEYIKEKLQMSKITNIWEENDIYFLETVFADREVLGKVVLEDIYIKIIPSSWKLYDEDQPEIWHFIVANRAHIILAEPMFYAHNQIPYVASNWTGNIDEIIGWGVVDFLMDLQRVLDWLYNTRIDNINRAIQGLYIIDPMIIDDKELREGKAVKYLYLKQGARIYANPVDRGFQYVPIPDVTTTHLAEVGNLFNMMKQLSGLNELLLGLLPTKRMTGKEYLGASSAALDFMRGVVIKIGDNILKPLVEMAVANNQQYITVEDAVKILGSYHEKLLSLSKQYSNLIRFVQANQGAEGAKMLIQQATPDIWFLRVNPEDLAGSFDFRYADVLSPYERQNQVSSLMNLLQLVAPTPYIANLNVLNIIRYIMDSLGVKNIDDFIISNDEKEAIKESVSKVIK